MWLIVLSGQNSFTSDSLVGILNFLTTATLVCKHLATKLTLLFDRGKVCVCVSCVKLC